MSGSEKIMNDETNRWPTFQYSLKFQVLTDVSVAHQPDWTRGHQQGHILHSSSSAADAYILQHTTTKFYMVTHMGRGVWEGRGQPHHCIWTNASRGLSATAEFLVKFFFTSWVRSKRNEIIIKDLTTSQIHRYTTLWKVNVRKVTIIWNKCLVLTINFNLIYYSLESFA